jgi:hypothetical protein
MAFEPGHDHAHHGGHGTGVKWLDIIVGLSAVLISVVSLVVSFQHGQTMEKMVDQNERMVAANTLPFLTVDDTQLDARTNQPRFSLVLNNGGVGPAVIDRFQLRYKGVAYHELGALLRACCAEALSPKGPSAAIYSNISGSILPPRETREPIVIVPNGDMRLYNAFLKARPDISYDACYCSVLDECWRTDFSPGRPSRVKDCRVPAGAKLW